MYRNPNYTGITPEFWGSCDAVGGREDWTVWGTPNCGKGQPGQVGRVGHGTSPGALPQRPGRGALMPGLIGRGRVRDSRGRPRSSSPGVDGVEVLLLHEWGGLTRFANSAIHQSTSREDTGLRVRVVSRRPDRRRVARTSSRRGRAPRGAASAKEMAEVVAPDPLFPGLAPKAAAPMDAMASTRPRRPSTRSSAPRRVEQLVGQAADGFAAAGAYETTAVELGLANTEGQCC